MTLIDGDRWIPHGCYWTAENVSARDHHRPERPRDDSPFGTAQSLLSEAGFFPLALGEALMGPVMVAAIKRYATTAQRSISFSIFYAMMNAGLLVANYCSILSAKAWASMAVSLFRCLGMQLSTYRTLFLVSTLLTVPSFILLWCFFRDGVEVTEQGVHGSAGPGAQSDCFETQSGCFEGRMPGHDADFRRVMGAGRVLQIPGVPLAGGLCPPDLLSHVLHVSEVWHKGTWRGRSGRAIVCGQFRHHHFPGADRRAP